MNPSCSNEFSPACGAPARDGRQDVGFRVSVDRQDAHRLTTRFATPLAILGLVLGWFMATFGLPPIDLHGPLHHLGIMDPLCGGTRAVRLAAQGHLALSWRYNPLGIIVLAGAVGVVTRTFAGVAARRWINLKLRLTRRQKHLLLLLLAAAVLGLEIRQQLHADLLTAGA